MGNSIEDFAARLAELKASFVARLPETLAALETAWEACREAGAGPERYRALHALAHRLTGTGGTLGVPRSATLPARWNWPCRLSWRPRPRQGQPAWPRLPTG
ncbi:MAG: Hpt domain-containing protein [Candidatus Riflebacteria bacterium]|nr:Hpt domain-containing protein [Candidatus Riflebacteria bacterium]